MNLNNIQFKTVQEDFWSGEFGNEYTDRNAQPKVIGSNVALFSSIIAKTQQVNSIMEYGANIGLNLKALKHLNDKFDISALEINKHAAKELRAIQGVKVFEGSMLEFVPQQQWDFVFTKALLIHIKPSELKQAYKIIYESSKRYICLIELYNPVPVEVNYRGHLEILVKRDFAGEFLDLYKDCSLVSYGFVYNRDIHFPQGDVTWFLLEKKQ